VGGGRNLPAALQRAITVLHSLFSQDVKTRKFLYPFSDVAIGFIIYFYATVINVENVPNCVRKIIFGHFLLQYVKKCSNSVPAHSLSSS
jgi:hypothetical protein